jgi:nucleotide-binding universal stress UspA family protein
MTELRNRSGRVLVLDDIQASATGIAQPIRALIEKADDLYIVAPISTPRLQSLATDVDRARVSADERLRAVFDRKPSGQPVSQPSPGVARPISGARNVVALRNDARRRASSPSGQLILCYDGSADATHAIEVAGAMFAGTRALVLTVWQPTLDVNAVAWSATTPTAASYGPDPAAKAGVRMAEQGARLARHVGLEAEPVALEASGAVWKTIIEIANPDPRAIIVTGSRGRTGLGSRLLGSVSSAVVRHAQQPTLVIPRHGDDRGAA